MKRVEEIRRTAEIGSIQEGVEDVAYLWVPDPVLYRENEPFCRTQRMVEVVSLTLWGNTARHHSLVCDVLRKNYASIRWFVCPYDDVWADVRELACF